MDIRISPVTPYNSFVKDANGIYTIETIINHNVYRVRKTIEKYDIND